MDGAIIILISTILQFAAALVSLRLIKITGKTLSWGLISSAIFLMAIRRTASFLKYIQSNNGYNFDLQIELIALLISILMLLGLVLISPLFKSMNEAIEKLKIAEKISSENEKKLRNITSSIAEGIYVKNIDGSLEFMNNEAERLAGWSYDELKGKNIHDVLHCNEYGNEESEEDCKIFNEARKGNRFSSSDIFFNKKEGGNFPVSVISSPIYENGEVVSVVTAFRDITVRKNIEKEREELIVKLQKSLDTIKVLSGIIPICASCKKIRDDKGYWTQLEAYIAKHSEADFSHGICPECAAKHYPEFFAKIAKKGSDSNVVS